MVKIIIQDKDKGTEEIMEMPQDAWNRILEIAEEEKKKKSKKGFGRSYGY